MPDWRTEIQRRVAAARLAPEREREIVDELAQHLDDRYRASRAAGLTTAEAEALAWRELEHAKALGVELGRIERPAPPALAQTEAPRQGAWPASIWQDLRYCARTLRQRPVFTLTAIITISLSLGPAIAVSALTDRLFFRPLPRVVDQSRLVTFQFGVATGTGFSPWAISYANLAAISAGSSTMTELTGQQLTSVAISANDAAPRVVTGQSVMANYFAVLGVPMSAGRTFRADEDSTPGGQPVVVLADSLARQLFPDASAVGQHVRLNSLPFEVIGVTASGFQGDLRSGVVGAWVTGMTARRLSHFPPALWTYNVNRGPFYEFVVRLAPGASPAQAAAELGAKSHALAVTDPAVNAIFKTRTPKMMPGLGAPLSLNQTAYSTASLLLAIAGVLVLLGMANVANLLLFQGLATARELAIRKALGASAYRILQLRLLQSLVLAIVGAGLGIVVALGLGALLGDFVVPGIGLLKIVISWRVAAVAVCLALLVGLGFGVGPAWLAARSSVTNALIRGVRVGMPRTNIIRQTLTVAQLALSLTLLSGGLLFLVTLHHLHAIDLGMDPTDVTTMYVDVERGGYSQSQALAYHRRLIEAVAQAPGIDSVAVAYALPLSGLSFATTVYEAAGDPGQATHVVSNGITHDYFRVLGSSLVRGRMLTSDEIWNGSQVDHVPVVVSETLAMRVFDSTDVVGRRLTTPTTARAAAHDYEIVGVARDSHWKGVANPSDAILYQPLAVADGDATTVSILARSTLRSADVVRIFQRAATALDPSIPLAFDETMRSAIDERLGEQRLFAWVFGALAVIGFVLAATGLYGLVAQGVSERTREFAVRMAVGASGARVVRLVLRQTAVVAILGTALGLLLVWMGGRMIEARLFGVTSHDPVVVGVSVCLLGVVALIASLGPARVATQVNPVDALRSE